jgi:hypothetical protein
MLKKAVIWFSAGETACPTNAESIFYEQWWGGLQPAKPFSASC